MKNKILQKNREAGFVLLFAVTLASLLLAIALGVANIALKEVKFGTNARDANEAFFAADTGIEKVLFNDRSDNNSYVAVSGQTFTWDNIVVSGLGGTGKSCAIVKITKDDRRIAPVTAMITTIVSKGYNTGSGLSGSCSPTDNSVERQIVSNY